MRASGREYFDLARWARLGMFLMAAAVGMGGCKGENAQQQAQQQQLGCQSDRDCKGDRICVDHECVDPPTPVAAEPQEKKIKPQVKEAMTTRYQLSWYKQLLDKWFQKNPDKCPSSFDEFVNNPRFEGRHKDGWGQPYILKCGDTAPEGHKFGVLSLGPDGQEGTSDDLRTWKPKDAPAENLGARR